MKRPIKILPRRKLPASLLKRRIIRKPSKKIIGPEKTTKPKARTPKNNKFKITPSETSIINLAKTPGIDAITLWKKACDHYGLKKMQDFTYDRGDYKLTGIKAVKKIMGEVRDPL